MKLGTVLSALAAATLVVAQPALAATRSASSLPAVGTKISSIEGRTGSKLRNSEAQILGAGTWVLTMVAVGAALVAMWVFVLDEDSFDGTEDLPDSPA